MRSGKALAKDRQEIAVYFRSVPHLAFEADICPPVNVVRLQLNPDQIGMTINLNGPDEPFDLEEFELKTALAKQTIPPYGHLVLDIIEGEPALFIRDDEAEEMWRIMDPILRVWKKKQEKLMTYPAGSAGPNCSDHCN